MSTEVNNSVNVKGIVAECVGSFILMFCYMGVYAYTTALNNAIFMGFIFLALYYSIGKFTRCHLNPAVSLAFLIDGKLQVLEFILFAVVQIVGACLGSLALFGFYEMVYNLDKTNFAYDGTNIVFDYFNKGYTPRGFFSCLLTEIILTMILCFVIISVEKDGDLEEVKGLAIAAVYAFTYFAGIGVNHGCLNPARNLAACLSQVTYFERTKGFEVCFIFIIGPMVGAIIGAILAIFINGAGSTEPKNDQGDGCNEKPRNDNQGEPRISDEKNIADSQRPINQEQVNVGRNDDEKRGTMVDGEKQDGEADGDGGAGKNKKNVYSMLIK